MSRFFDVIEQWLEAPQVVLDGTELLILCVLILVGAFVFCRSAKEQKRRRRKP